MHLIRITASSEVLSGLTDVPELNVVKSSVDEVGGGQFSVGAYASDAAIQEIGRRGARVEVLLDADTRMAQLSRVAEEARGSTSDEESS